MIPSWVFWTCLGCGAVLAVLACWWSYGAGWDDGREHEASVWRYPETIKAEADRRMRESADRLKDDMKAALFDPGNRSGLVKPRPEPDGDRWEEP